MISRQSFQIRIFFLLLLTHQFLADWPGGIFAQAEESVCGQLMGESHPTHFFESTHGGPSSAKEKRRLMASLNAKIKQGLLNSPILNKCREKGVCTREQWTQSIKSVIANLGYSEASRYAYLVGGIALTSAATAGLLVWVNDYNIQFWPSFGTLVVSQVSFLTANLLAPFLEPISSKIRRSTYAMTSQNKLIQDNRSLEDQADHIQSTYTLREQHSTDRIMQFRGAILQSLIVIQMLSTVENRDKIELVDEITPHLAEVIMLGYRHFRDLDPRDETILNAVKASGLRSRIEPKLLMEKVYSYISEVEFLSESIADRSADIQLRESYYRRLLSIWLGSSSS